MAPAEDPFGPGDFRAIPVARRKERLRSGASGAAGRLTRSGLEQALLAPGVSAGAHFFLGLARPGQGGLRVAFGGRERCAESYLVQRTTYPYATVEYVADGEGLIRYGDNPPQPLRPGCVFAHGPGVRLRMETAPGRTLLKYFVCFAGRGARAAIVRHASLGNGIVALAHHGDLRELFDWLIREGNEHGPSTRAICDRLGQLLLLKIGDAGRHRGSGRQDAAREKFLRCKALIDEDPTRFSSLETLATTLHVENSGLNRLFRRYQGVSPYRYLLRAKMNLAARDLLHSGGLVKEVAAQVGYADPYHFSRVFKSVHGVSPANFAKQTPPMAGRRR